MNNVETPAVIIAGILSIEFLDGWFGVILSGLLIILTFIKILKELGFLKDNNNKKK